MSDPAITVRVPSVAHKGPHDTDARIFRTVADNLLLGYDAGGSNVRRAVATLLVRVAAALDAKAPPFGVVDDGFGSSWPRCKTGCGLQVVRPGKVQCDCDYQAVPDA